MQFLQGVRYIQRDYPKRTVRPGFSRQEPVSIVDQPTPGSAVLQEHRLPVSQQQAFQLEKIAQGFHD